MAAHPLTPQLSPKAAEYPITQGNIDIIDFIKFNHFHKFDSLSLTWAVSLHVHLLSHVRWTDGTFSPIGHAWQICHVWKIYLSFWSLLSNLLWLGDLLLIFQSSVVCPEGFVLRSRKGCHRRMEKEDNTRQPARKFANYLSLNQTFLIISVTLKSDTTAVSIKVICNTNTCKKLHRNNWQCPEPVAAVLELLLQTYALSYGLTGLT